MKRNGRIAIGVVLTVLFGLFSLPQLIFGLYLLNCWFRIHTAAVYYLEYPYLLAALIWVCVAAMSVASVLYAAWRRSFYGLLFCFPLLVGMASMVLIPDAYPHDTRSGIADFNYLSSVNSFLRIWYEAHHSFPANETEFREALARGPAAWQYRVQAPPADSCYGRSGARLPYEIVVVTNANGPRIDNLSERPAVIYYSVSGDHQEFWATMTALQHEVAPTASLKKVVDRPDAKGFVVGAAGKDYPVTK